MAVIGKTGGLVAQLMDKLEALSTRLGLDVEVYSGKRAGSVDASAHNSGIAADVRIPGKLSVAVADELVKEGFSAVGEYYKPDDTQWTTAHGDIRGLPGSEGSGAYRPGGAKSSKRCWTGVGNPPDEPKTTPGRRSKHACPQDA
jgi:hypothetical protein